MSEFSKSINSLIDYGPTEPPIFQPRISNAPHRSHECENLILRNEILLLGLISEGD